MATQLISAPGPSIPLGEVLSPESQPLQDYHRKLVEASHGVRVNLAIIAFYGWRMRLADGWTLFGFESGPKGEEAYRESLGIPHSTWYKHVRIGQYLHQLSLEDLCRIPTTNCELLTQVDPSIIHDHPWVSDAKRLKPAELANLVATRNKEVGAREPLATMMFKVPFLAKAAMGQMLERVQAKYELSSKGQALELMIADLHQDVNLVAAADKALRLLGGVVESMKLRGAPASDETRWLQMAMEVLNEGYEKAVQTAREKAERNQKNGGRA